MQLSPLVVLESPNQGTAPLVEPEQVSPVPLTLETSLSSLDFLSVCPLRLEKPSGESNFFFTAISSLAEHESQGEIAGRTAGP